MEECWFVYGLHIWRYFIGLEVYHSKGTESSVSFLWEKAISRLCIGWCHTHPTKNILPSPTDHRTMRSWVKGLNRSFLCGIRYGSKTDYYCFRRLKEDRSKIGYNKLKHHRIGAVVLAKIYGKDKVS